MSKFLVYKSSAGSGKTYTLMLEYLSMALMTVNSYNHILAVTFTNKAANEIKHRILETLKSLASLEDGSQVPENRRELVVKLCERTGLSEEKLFSNAQKVLTSILHNYSDFAVSTIDSFMHRVIRSFAFDLKLSMSFEVELDTDMLLSAAVDELINQVGKDVELTKILQEYVIRQAENDDTWDISDNLKKFGSSLLKEKMLGLIPALNDKEFSIEDFKKIVKGVDELKNSCKSEGEKALALINSVGLGIDDFYQGTKGIGQYFKTISDGVFKNGNSYVAKALNDDIWFTKNPGRDAALAPVKDGLVKAAAQICAYLPEIKLMELVKNNFHSTILLKKINEELKKIKEERNLVSINDFNTLISEVVREQPVPFVYLKVGERFRDYMIDEFQDTSVMQWQNLLPLFENSLANDNLNMIVGDGKQAIYRFKNGDADQFINLPLVSNPLDDQLVKDRENLLRQQYNGKNLDTNYRSREEIVEFNNNFFEFAARLFVPGNTIVYEDVRQKCKPDNQGGLVKFEFAACDDIIPRILDLVHEAKSDGFAYGDIAILCRNNKNAVRVAEALKEDGIKVVSSESLLLCSTPEVNFLVNWINYLANPGNRISMQGIMECLFLFYPELLQPVNYRNADKKYLYQLLDRVGVQINENTFRGVSFYDSIEKLVREFGLNERNPVYVRFFLDEVLKYTQKESSGPSGFIQYWEDKKFGLSVSIAQHKNAVQVLTVHKSKGLDFPVVIYAFPDQKREIGDLSWQMINMKFKDGDEKMPLVYKYSNDHLEGTVLHADYCNELAKVKLDKFNLYYVAFTRASERLYVVLEDLPQKSSSKIEYACLADLVKAYLLKVNNGNTFGKGSKVVGKYSNVLPHNSNVDKTISLDYTTGDWNSRITIAKRAPESWIEVTGKIDYGKLVHLILSRVTTLDQVQQVIDNIFDGSTSDHDETKNTILRNLNVLARMKEILPFFDGGRVIREQEIISSTGDSYRPDRVVCHGDATYVIDFKTGKTNKKYNDQVLTYVSLIKDMGYPNPRGYILYIGDIPELIDVKESEVKV